MDKFQEISLGHEAIEYIRKRLEQRWRTLCEYVLEKIELETGQVTTPIAEGGHIEEIYDFEGGRVVPTAPESEWYRGTGPDGQKFIAIPKHVVDAHVVEAIRSFLGARKGGICILEDAMGRPGDRGLQLNKSYFVTFQNEVYHLLIGRELSDSEIVQSMSEAEHAYPPLFGILTSLPDAGHTFFTTHKLTPDILRVMAERTEKIIVGAYDGEGYLIWHRQPPLSR